MGLWASGHYGVLCPHTAQLAVFVHETQLVSDVHIFVLRNL